MNKWTNRLLLACQIITLLTLLYSCVIQGRRIAEVEAQNVMLWKALDVVTKAEANR